MYNLLSDFASELRRHNVPRSHDLYTVVKSKRPIFGAAEIVVTLDYLGPAWKTSLPPLYDSTRVYVDADGSYLRADEFWLRATRLFDYPGAASASHHIVGVFRGGPTGDRTIDGNGSVAPEFQTNVVPERNRADVRQMIVQHYIKYGQKAWDLQSHLASDLAALTRR